MLLRVSVCLLVSCLSLLSSPLQAQADSDSLYQLVRSQPRGEEAWVSTTYAYCRQELRPDSSVKYARLALEQSTKLDLPHWQLKLHELLARALLNNRTKLDSADLHLTEAMGLYRSVPDSLLYLGSLLRIRGEYFRQKGDFERSIVALEAASEAIERGLQDPVDDADERALRYKQILILNARGNVLKNQGRCQDAIVVQEEVFRLASQQGNTEQMGYATFNKGGCYFILGDYPRALDAYLSSLRLLDDSVSLQSMVANASLAIGAIFAETGEIDSARTYFKRALRVGSDFQRTRTRIGTYENLGGLELLAERYDSATYYYQQAVDLARDGERWTMLVSNLTQLGGVYLQTGQPDMAFRYLSEANALADQHNARAEKAYVLITLAEYYLELGQAREALSRLSEAREFVEAYPTADLKRRIYLARSKSFEQQGKFQQALMEYRRFVVLEDSLNSESQVREITQLNMQHEFEKERAEAEVIQQQKDLLVAERLQRQAMQRNSLIGILLAVAILAFLLWRGYQRKQKTNALLESKNQVIQESLEEKETLLREIHHRVKNNLQVISSLLSIQSRHVKDESVQDAIEEGRNRVRSMAMIHENLYKTDHLTGIDISSYIDNLTHGLFESYNINADLILLKTDISPMRLDVDTVIPLGLIINELITNALKYAFPEEQNGQIAVSLKETSNGLTLEVGDNGVGMPVDLDPQRSQTMGFKLIRAFLAKLKGTMEIHRLDGTQVRLHFTQYQRA